jgi:hypothetical protein
MHACALTHNTIIKMITGSPRGCLELLNREYCHFHPYNGKRIITLEIFSQRGFFIHISFQGGGDEP